MRLIFLLICAFLISACEPTKKVVETPLAPEVAPNPTMINKPTSAEPQFRMINIIGLEKTTVENILGVPSLKRVEKQAEVWLYDNQFCNAHVYFYENDNSDMHVEYIETSEEKNLMDLEGQRADFCISTFLQD